MKLCACCGKHSVIPIAKSGRTTPYKTFESLRIPDDLPIPTCTNCGAEWIDAETAKALDAALEAENIATI